MSANEPLDGLWYLAALSAEVKPGAMLRRILFGDPIVLGRTKASVVFALRDVCPHRAAPLSAGRLCEIAGETAVECPYHAWAFRASDGKCAAVPALHSEEARDPSTISTKRFALHEANGLIWIHHGDGAPETAPPDIGLSEGFRPKSATIVDAAGPFDEAVIGLVDPAHTPTVHKQWWWREGAARRDKVKSYEPTPLGFKMLAHRPSTNTRIYKFIGGAPTTEIEFRLPALRLEHIRNDRRRILGLTAMTPAEPQMTRIAHVIFWDFAVLDLIRPVAQSMADDFLAQDGAILSLQNENLKRGEHRPLYFGEADEPAKWYLRLKRAWQERRESGFKNPLAPASLRWRT
ncbi:MAG: aromatic ring-hydroxylating dioxygenase subunit alpha [Parvularculaceae bacterium]|nr:aromatic ring-hydroxylating dioxygenase subunit alpha [Parvularculaceae bacterium]